jgi:hypothetical protein
VGVASRKAALCRSNRARRRPARAGLSGGARRAPRAQTCAAVLDGVAKLLVNYQRNLRVARERALAAERGTEEGAELQEEGEPDDDELGTPPPLPAVAPIRVPTVHSLPPSLAGAMNVEEWIGRQGHATVLLRVLQLVCSGEHSAAMQDPPPPSLPYKVDTSRPSLRTNWTRLVPFRTCWRCSRRAR